MKLHSWIEKAIWAGVQIERKRLRIAEPHNDSFYQDIADARNKIVKGLKNSSEVKVEEQS